MESTPEDTKVCVKCGESLREGDALNHVGANYREGQDTKHPLDTMIEHALKLELDTLVTALRYNKATRTATYIHLTCRNYLKNKSRPKRTASSHDVPVTAKRPSTRSEVGNFDFKEQCFYCEKICFFDSEHPDRGTFANVGTKDTCIHRFTLELCKSRQDTYAKTIERHLLNVSDIVAVEARYHTSCRSSFENPVQKYAARGRPPSSEKLTVFLAMCEKLEDEIDLYTVKEFHEDMEKLSDDVYSVKMTKMKLMEKYGNSVQFVTRKSKSDIILLDRLSATLTENWYNERKSNPVDEAERIIKTAAKLLKNVIKNHEHESDYYLCIEDIINTTNDHVPSLLKTFISELVKTSLKQMSISQAIFSATRPMSLMPLQFGLAVATDNRLSSKWLNSLLCRLGFAVSYDEVIRYKQNIVKHDAIDEVICPYETTFLQYVGDNTDHDLATVDVKHSHHGLWSIVIANGTFADTTVHREALPRDKKQNWSDITPNKGIEIKQYHQPDIPALRRTTIQPIVQETFHPCFLDLLWSCAHIFDNICPSWSGYMSSVSNNQPLTKSIVTMPPVINLHATDMTALYSLLSFVTEQCSKHNVPTPSITFDQPLYVKAYEIASSMNMDIFVRLGGFHQLMSFLGSIGCLSATCSQEKPTPVQYVVTCFQHQHFYHFYWKIFGMIRLVRNRLI